MEISPLGSSGEYLYIRSVLAFPLYSISLNYLNSFPPQKNKGTGCSLLLRTQYLQSGKEIRCVGGKFTSQLYLPRNVLELAQPGPEVCSVIYCIKLDLKHLLVKKKRCFFGMKDL